MDEISQEPRRDFRLPSGPRRWLVVAGVAGLVAAVTVFGFTRAGGRHGGHAASGPSATASPSIALLPKIRVSGTPYLQQVAAPAAQPAPGTVLLTCGSVVWGQPAQDWQTGSLRVGAMWLLDGRHLGYVRLGRTKQAARGKAASGGAGRDVRMLVHVGAGSTVVMRAATGESAYFEFLNSPGTTGDSQGADAGRGFTFVPCSAPDLGYGGLVGFYAVGFSIAAGHTASVEVWTSPSARPVWLTFTAPAGQG